MYRCLICRQETLLDDAVCPTTRGTCVCLTCYGRETLTLKRPAPWYARQIEAAAAGN